MSKEAGKFLKKSTGNIVMSKYLYIFDNGHGGLNPKNKQYVTPGKRSPKFADGKVLFEGVNNRDTVKRIIEGMTKAGLECYNLVDTWEDISLNDRCDAVNALAKTRNCIFVSIHSNGAGNGYEWHSATGIDVFMYTHPSLKTVAFANLIGKNLKENFDGVTKWRGVKNANFAVLRGTHCPAVLLELGFHTNEKETLDMITLTWKNKIVKSIVDTCLKWEEQ